jgi:ubiquitin C
MDNIKMKIYEKYGTRPIHQRLIFAGMNLEGQHTLASHNIKNDYTLNMVLRIN